MTHTNVTDMISQYMPHKILTFCNRVKELRTGMRRKMEARDVTWEDGYKK